VGHGHGAEKAVCESCLKEEVKAFALQKKVRRVFPFAKEKGRQL
jgi:hypothetical protein